MMTRSRETGFGVLGDMPWGTHSCHFYQTQQDYLDSLRRLATLSLTALGVVYGDIGTSPLFPSALLRKLRMTRWLLRRIAV